MRYFEIQEPYYALIKAKNKENAIEFYIEVVAEDEQNMLEREIKELNKGTALGIYAKSINSNTAVSEVVKEFEIEATDLLLIDSALI